MRYWVLAYFLVIIFGVSQYLILDKIESLHLDSIIIQSELDGATCEH